MIMTVVQFMVLGTQHCTWNIRSRHSLKNRLSKTAIASRMDNAHSADRGSKHPSQCLSTASNTSRGKRGVVATRVDQDHGEVEGVNVVKKHVKPNPMKGVTGGIVEKTMPVHQSNVAIFNSASGRADRVGVKLLADGKKVRVFRSSGEEIKV